MQEEMPDRGIIEDEVSPRPEVADRTESENVEPSRNGRMEDWLRAEGLLLPIDVEAEFLDITDQFEAADKAVFLYRVGKLESPLAASYLVRRAMDEEYCQEWPQAAEEWSHQLILDAIERSRES